jgi:cell division protein FtsL
MKWKDSGEVVDKEEKPKQEYFDEEQYSPWADSKEPKKQFKLGKVPFLIVLLAAAIIALIVVLMMLLNGNGDALNTQKVAALEARIQRLEESLDKYSAIDEKVTRIWEQAKSFEKFKDRFDRSEASTSLRMDHLTMSLEAIQKQLAAANRQPPPAPAAQESKEKSVEPVVSSKIVYHEVAPGDTLYSISKKYNMSLNDLRKMNHMEPNAVIVPGQKLIVQGEN